MQRTGKSLIDILLKLSQGDVFQCLTEKEIKMKAPINKQILTIKAVRSHSSPCVINSYSYKVVVYVRKP